tara:strand:- start:14879 stop:15082 length:204 start_codon:yes stop_codon:yes gene_type:complete
MARQTRRRLRYGGKKKKGTRARPRTRSSPRKRTGKRNPKGKPNHNSWGLNKGTSKGCVRVCLGSTLR